MKATSDAFNLKYRLREMQLDAAVEQIEELGNALLEARDEMLAILEEMEEDDG